MNEPLAPVLAEGILCGPTAVVTAFLFVVGIVGACRTLPHVVAACLMLPCSGSCSLCKPSIVPSCIDVAPKSQWQL